MGLDWILSDKPKENCKYAFAELSEKYKEIDERIVKNADEEKEQINELNKIVEQLKHVSITPYETIQCPKTSDSDETIRFFTENIYPFILRASFLYEKQPRQQFLI